MPQSSTCHSCDQELSSAGLCRTCLLKGVLGQDTEFIDATGPPEIDGYEIIEEVGRGGMGVVYRARQLQPEREVALKLVLDDMLAGTEARQTFLREVACAAQLEHPAVTPVYETGEGQGFLYFSSRFMPGGNLSERLQRLIPRRDLSKSDRRLRQESIAVIIKRLALALHFAHQRGIIHQDVKTSNILLDQNNEPYIADFGLASNASDALAASEISGSPAYMAPEQITKNDCSAAIDTYALGVVLYELLTGRPPFRESSLSTLFQQILQNPASFPDAPSHLDPSLRGICLKCLQKDPADRYGSARLLADDLTHFQELRPTHAASGNLMTQTKFWLRRKPGQALLAMALVLTLIGLIMSGALHYHLQRQRAQKDQADRIAAEHEERESRHRLADQLITQADQSGRDHEFQRAVTNLQEAAQLAHDAPDLSHLIHDLLENWKPFVPEFFHGQGNHRMRVRISPNGRELATWCSSETCLFWNLEGELRHSRNWEEDGQILDVTYSPDEKWIVISTPSHARVLDAKTLKSHAILPCQITAPVPGHRHRLTSIARFHPDSSRLIVAIQGDSLNVWNTDDFSMEGSIPYPQEFTFKDDFAIDILFHEEDFIIGFRGGFIVANLAHGTHFSQPTEAMLTSITLNSDGSHLATGDLNGEMNLYLTPTYKRSGGFTLKSGITELSFSDDGRILLSASRNRAAQLWKIGDDHSLINLSTLVHPAAVRAARWIRGSGLFATCAEDGFVRFYASGGREPVMRNRIKGGRLQRWDFHEETHQLIIGCERGNMLRLTLPQAPPIVRHLESTIREVRLNQESASWIGISDLSPGRHHISRWKKNEAAVHHEISEPSSRSSMSLSNDARFVFVGTNSGKAQLYDTRDFKLISTHTLEESSVRRTAVHADHDDEEVILATVSNTRVLSIFWKDDLAGIQSKQLAELPLCLRFSPDRSRLAMGMPSGEVWILDPGNLVTPPQILKQVHGNQVLTLEFDHTGKRLASGGMESRIFIHDLATGEAASPPLVQKDYVWSLAFSPDDSYLASGGQDLALHFFDLKSGLLLGPPRYQESWPNGLAFDDEGLITCGSDHTVRRITFPKRAFVKTR